MMLMPRAGAHSRRHRRRRSSERTPASTRRSFAPLSVLRSLPLRLLALSRSVVHLRPSMLRSLVPHRRRRRAPSLAGGPDGRWSRRRGVEQNPVERRRARAIVLAAAVFAFVVVFFTLPWSVMASQHQQLASDSSQVTALESENRALSAQAGALADPAAAAGLAREDYGLVRPGQRAYAILPAAGSGSSALSNAGHVPLNQAPVVPGSPESQQLLAAGAGSVTPPAAPRTSGSQSAGERSLSAPAGGQQAPAGFWSRVAHTLEFWS